MVIATPFSKPQKLIDRAGRALDAIQQSIETFFNLDSFDFIVEENSDTGEKRRKMVLIRPLPDSIEENATNALNNLRNSFDQMLFAACVVINRPIKDSHYPWSQSPTDLNDWKLRNKKTGKEGIPHQFWDIIRAQEPYKAGNGYNGGNTLVRAIATLANGKHTVGLQVLATVVNWTPATLKISGPSFVRVPMMPTWDPSRNEMEVMRWIGNEPEPTMNGNISFDVGFDETAGAELHSVSISGALRNFAAHAQSCLDGFKARTSELGYE